MGSQLSGLLENNTLFPPILFYTASYMIKKSQNIKLNKVFPNLA